jgi:hypothetical protein
VESAVLSGNEIAQLAMETSLPDENEIKEVRNEMSINDSENREINAKRLIEAGEIRKALCILI